MSDPQRPSIGEVIVVAAEGAPRAVPLSPPLRPVRFEFHAPAARRVLLVAEFADWDLEGIPMSRGDDGTWRVELSVPAGIYRYKFLVDSVWRCSPEQPRDCCDHPCQACPRCVPNLFGSVDRVAIV